MNHPAAHLLMEQQFGDRDFDDDPTQPLPSSRTTVTTHKTTSRTGSSTRPNGATTIRVGDDDDAAMKHKRPDYNHNVHMSSYTSSPGFSPQGQGRYLDVPGGGTRSSVVTTRTTKQRRTPSPRRPNRSAASNRPVTYTSERSSTVRTVPSGSSLLVQQQQGHLHSQQGGRESTMTELSLQGIDTQRGGGVSQQQVSQHQTPSRSHQQLEEMMHSPGGQSDASWASLPSTFKGPYPPGKAPIDITVHSPTPSDSSHDGPSSHRVREVRTDLAGTDTPTGSDDAPKGKRFLKKVQQELEEQRGKWKDDVDKLTGGMLGLAVEPNGTAYGTSSYVDTSTGRPIFKASIDMSGFDPKDITVTVDKLVNKAVVQAVQRDHTGFPKKTFTQRVQLPRFADDPLLTSKLGKNGQLKLQVPLIYHFADMHQEGRKAKSFVYQVNKGKDGSERLEILVNTGSGFRARDLKVQVHDDNRLVIIGVKQDGPNKLIKQYTLPAFANVDGITSKLGKDGRLQVNVPLNHNHRGDKG